MFIALPAPSRRARFYVPTQCLFCWSDTRTCFSRGMELTISAFARTVHWASRVLQTRRYAHQTNSGCSPSASGAPTSASRRRSKLFPQCFPKYLVLRSLLPDATIQIATGYLARLKEKWGSIPQIKFLGYLDEDQLDEVFRTAHVAVMPYLSSGGPSGVAHIAARFGLPIVAAEVDDFVRLAEEEGLAIDTYLPGNSVDLASRLIALAHDPARQARMADQNYQVAMRSTMPRIVASYLAEFRRLLDKSRQLPAAPEGEATAAYPRVSVMALHGRTRRLGWANSQSPHPPSSTFRIVRDTI